MIKKIAYGIAYAVGFMVGIALIIRMLKGLFYLLMYIFAHPWLVLAAVLVLVIFIAACVQNVRSKAL